MFGPRLCVCVVVVVVAVAAPFTQRLEPPLSVPPPHPTSAVLFYADPISAIFSLAVPETPPYPLIPHPFLMQNIILTPPSPNPGHP